MMLNKIACIVFCAWHATADGEYLATHRAAYTPQIPNESNSFIYWKLNGEKTREKSETHETTKSMCPETVQCAVCTLVRSLISTLYES